MRKIRMLLVGVLMAVPVVGMTAGPAMACKQYPCPAACKLNPPVIIEDDAIIFNDRRLVECYY
jgi:hypothetical protein